MSIIKQVALQKIVAHDFRYDPRKKNQTFASCYLHRFHRRTLSIAPDNIHLDYKPHYADGEDIAPTRRSCITGLAVICGPVRR